VLKLEPVWHDQLGEAALLSMLAEVAPSVLARAAAAGWGGDQLVAFDRPGEPLDAPAVVAAVAWDSESDAREFERGFAKYLTDVVATGTFIVRKGDVVVFGTHVPEGVDPDAVAAAVLESVRVERGRTSGRSGKGGTKGGSARRPSP
jgi:hypothetical protein